MFVTLIAFDGFHLLLSTQLTADLTPEWSGGSIITYLCKKLLFVALKQLQTTLWIIDALLFLIDCVQIWHPLWTQLPHAKWWILCFLMSSTPLLSNATLIYDQSKWDCRIFLCFLGQLPNLGNLSIQHHSCLYDHI